MNPLALPIYVILDVSAVEDLVSQLCLCRLAHPHRFQKRSRA